MYGELGYNPDTVQSCSFTYGGDKRKLFASDALYLLKIIHLILVKDFPTCEFSRHLPC